MPPKKSKTTKKTADTEAADAGTKPYEEIIAEDPDFHLDWAKFKFPNEDTYEGEFCAHVSGLIWRQGKGKYTTKEGQVYCGYWDGDKLVESKEVEIFYPDGTTFIGNLLKNQYSGPAIYQLDTNVSLTGNFLANKPSGEITIIDPNDKAWHGFCEKDECLLNQEHSFYSQIGKDLGKGLSKKTPDEAKESKSSMTSLEKPDTSDQTDLRYRDVRDLEKDIFAKSKKTPADLQFENSEWYQDYVTYHNTYSGIIEKVNQDGVNSLSTEEIAWYKEYKEFERKFIAILQNRKHKSKKLKTSDLNLNALFQYIHSDEYREANKPSPVFYPRAPSSDGDCASFCEC